MVIKSSGMKTTNRYKSLPEYEAVANRRTTTVKILGYGLSKSRFWPRSYYAHINSG
ncbi:MAG: hypothetical protein RLZZ367_326 [Bacteroidota bacterium]|jgi:hypothetical protein